MKIILSNEEFTFKEFTEHDWNQIKLGIGSLFEITALNIFTDSNLIYITTRKIKK